MLHRPARFDIARTSTRCENTPTGGGLVYSAQHSRRYLDLVDLQICLHFILQMGIEPARINGLSDTAHRPTSPLLSFRTRGFCPAASATLIRK